MASEAIVRLYHIGDKVGVRVNRVEVPGDLESEVRLHLAVRGIRDDSHSSTIE